MAKRKAPHSFPIPLFGGQLVVCRSRAEWRYAMLHFGADDGSDSMAGLATSFRRQQDGCRSYVVGVFDGSVGTLSHELGHAIFYLLGDVGVEVTAGRTNETFCYLLGNLMFSILPYFGAATHAKRRQQ